MKDGLQKIKGGQKQIIDKIKIQQMKMKNLKGTMRYSSKKAHSGRKGDQRTFKQGGSTIDVNSNMLSNLNPNLTGVTSLLGQNTADQIPKNSFA